MPLRHWLILGAAFVAFISGAAWSARGCTVNDGAWRVGSMVTAGCNFKAPRARD